MSDFTVYCTVYLKAQNDFQVTKISGIFLIYFPDKRSRSDHLRIVHASKVARFFSKAGVFSSTQTTAFKHKHSSLNLKK